MTTRNILATVILHLAAAMPQSARASQPKVEVLIYYANETALEGPEARSWDTIIGWLEPSPHPEAKKIVEQLRHDREGFAPAVDADVGILRERLPRLRPVVGGAIFTNRLARRGKCLVLPEGASEFQEPALSLPNQENYILAANPMADAANLARCLGEVARRFDPAAHEFILVTKSHGSPKMALTPRLAVRAEETTKEELLSILAGQVPADRRPRWAGRVGITKDQLFATLGEAHAAGGMHFSLVFVEACSGVLGEDVTVRAPDNVDRLYLTGREKTSYRNLDYAAILSDEQGERLAPRLDAALAGKFPVVSHGRAPIAVVWRTLRFALLCLPLVAWAAWIVVRRARRVRG